MRSFLLCLLGVGLQLLAQESPPLETLSAEGRLRLKNGELLRVVDVVPYTKTHVWVKLPRHGALLQPMDRFDPDDLTGWMEKAGRASWLSLEPAALLMKLGGAQVGTYPALEKAKGATNWMSSLAEMNEDEIIRWMKAEANRPDPEMGLICDLTSVRL